jgi:glycosyltransferase involved in cell wall biosynthesis
LGALGYRVVVLGHRAHALSVATLLGLRRLIREIRPSIVQTSLPRANYWGRIAAVAERVPVVIAEEHSVSERSDRVRPLIERALGPRTDCVVAVSESVRRAVSAMDRASASRPTTVLRNPVNVARMALKRGRAEVRAQLGLAQEQPVVVHAGRMTATRGSKGQDLLIDAMPRVLEVLPDAVCLLLGDGPARRSLEAVAARRGVDRSVCFLGYRRDMADYVAAADVFVLPSRVEGMPLALMEAMWLGVPAIASDIPANREVLSDGRYGLLFAAGSAERLADAIVFQMGEAVSQAQRVSDAREYARSAFSPETYARNMAALWEQLLAARERRSGAKAS